VPYLIFAVTIAWIVINFKLRAATGCKLFAVYTALLIVDVAADIIYGMMFKIPAPAAITMGVINCMELLNLILNPLASVVLLLAWLNIKNPHRSKGSMEPGGEIKFARVYTARSLNLDCAGAFANMKFHAARAVCQRHSRVKTARCSSAQYKFWLHRRDPRQD